MLILILTWIAQTTAIATEYFPYGLQLRWFFPSEGDITFEYWVPKYYEDVFDWAGIAIQDSGDSQETFRCDYYLAFMADDGVFTDRFSTVNGNPPLDEKIGGTNDITASRRYEGNFLIFSATRKLVTTDTECDVMLKMNHPYEIKWALGPLFDGEIEQHSLKYMGYEFILLQDEYLDFNVDERRRYGPWHEHELTGIPGLDNEDVVKERLLPPEIANLLENLDETASN